MQDNARREDNEWSIEELYDRAETEQFIASSSTSSSMISSSPSPSPSVTTRMSGYTEDVYNLTSLQEGMLFHSLLSPSSGVYITQNAYSLGSTNISQLKQSWTILVARHSILRTRYTTEEHTSKQIVERRVTLPWTELDWTLLDDAQFDRLLTEHMEQDRMTDFAVDIAPLMRYTVIYGRSKSILVWTSHHILLDGWSMPLLLTELSEIYSQLSMNKTEQAIMKEMTEAVGFGRYIEWMNEQDKKKALDFWIDQLQRNSNEIINRIVPENSSKSNLSSNNVESIKDLHISLSQLEVDAIIGHLQKHRITINTFVQCIWAYTLSICSPFISTTQSTDDDRRVMFGATVSGRSGNLQGVESMIGLFINTLPVVISIDSRKRVGEWMREVQMEQIEARQYEYASLVDIQSSAGWNGSLFDHVLVFENYPVAQKTANSSSLTLQRLRVVEKTNFAFAVTAEPNLDIILSYDPSKLPSEHVNQIRTTITQLMKKLTISDNFERSVSAVLSGDLNSTIDIDPSFSDEEQQQRNIEWNDTALSFANTRRRHKHTSDFVSITTEIDKQCKRTPDSIALVMDEQQVSYKQLQDMSDSICKFIMQQYGVREEETVTVKMDKSIEGVASLLGVWKSGGAAVMIDTQQPDDRNKLIESIANSRCTIDDDMMTQWNKWNTNKASSVDNGGRLDAGMSKAYTTKANNAAYIVFTSGSTGIPKGVVVEHSGIVDASYYWSNLVRSNLSHEQDVRFLSRSSVAFDVFVHEIVTPFISFRRDIDQVGTLIMTAQRLDRDTEYMIKAIQQHQVNVFPPSPSLLLSYMELESSLSCDSVEIVASGSEALPRMILDRALDRDLVVTNAYGPSEATIDVSTQYYTNKNAAKRRKGERVSIGRAETNVQLHLVELDSFSKTQTEGELVVAGRKIARGYVRQAAVTASKFTPHWNATNARDSRVYRTGDECKTGVSGELEFKDRVDYQVKIRGYRVELGEIEAIMNEYEGVLTSVAVAAARSSDEASKRIVAFFVRKSNTDEETFSNQQLRGYLKRRLPSYMIPSLLLSIDALPLNANDKIDRKALITLATSQNHSEDVEDAEYKVLASNSAEISIESVWMSVLGITDHISVLESFFDIGGNSLLAVRAVSKMRQEGISVSLQDLVKYPTIQGLAALASTSNDALITTSVKRANYNTADHKLFYFASLPVTTSSTEINKFKEALPSYNIIGLDYPDIANAFEDINEAAYYFVTAIRRIQPRGPYDLMGYSFGGVLALIVAKQLQTQGESVRLIMVDSAPPPFDASNEAFVVSEQFNVVHRPRQTIHNLLHKRWDTRMLESEMTQTLRQSIITSDLKTRGVSLLEDNYYVDSSVFFLCCDKGDIWMKWTTIIPTMSVFCFDTTHSRILESADFKCHILRILNNA